VLAGFGPILLGQLTCGKPSGSQHHAAAGFQGLQLGPRVLRTETAGLAAIAAVQARLGDLG